MNVSLKSQIKLYSLYIRKEKQHYIVEEPSSGNFFEMPEICIEAIELINKGDSLQNIEKELKLKYPEEEVNLLEFTEQLFDLGLIKSLDGKDVPAKKIDKNSNGFLWISPKVGRFFFNQVTHKIYLVLFAINILLMIKNPQFFPIYKDLFLFDTMMFNVLLWMGLTFFLVLIHEFGHILAIRSYSLPAKLGVGHRFLLVVLETDLSLAWKLSQNDRNKLFFAGINFDQVMLIVALTLQLVFDHNNPIIIGICGVVVFDIFVRLIYQCCFYMKTDLYYFYENITGCYNMMENSKKYLSKWLPIIKNDPTTDIFKGEEKTVRYFSLFYISGYIVTLGLFTFYFIPQAFYSFKIILPGLLEPIHSPFFWDSLIFIGQFILIFCLLIYSIYKKYFQVSYS